MGDDTDLERSAVRALAGRRDSAAVKSAGGVRPGSVRRDRVGWYRPVPHDQRRTPWCAVAAVDLGVSRTECADVCPRRASTGRVLLQSRCGQRARRASRANAPEPALPLSEHGRLSDHAGRRVSELTKRRTVGRVQRIVRAHRSGIHRSRRIARVFPHGALLPVSPGPPWRALSHGHPSSAVGGCNPLRPTSFATRWPT